MSKVLQRKAIVVTGAGRGLGEAYARAAAAEGARVVVNDIDRAEAERVAQSITQSGGAASPKVADIASWRGAEELVEFCVQQFGRLDGFVNNAALFHMATPLEENEASLRRIVEVNVLGTAFCGYHALRQMLKQGAGSLVNVTSGAHAGIKSMSAYGATKGAAASLVYSWALDTAGTGVRVNAISPVADTSMSVTRDAFNDSHRITTPKRPSLPPENNAPVVVYLLSDLAEGVTGQVVRVQGKSLSLVTHPAALSPGVDSDEWSVEKVSKAFDEQLRAQQLPCGVQAYAVEVKDYQVPYLGKGVQK